MTAIVVASTIRICEINAGSSPRDSIERGLAATVSHRDLIFLNVLFAGKGDFSPLMERGK
jgi:hypothetical protein